MKTWIPRLQRLWRWTAGLIGLAALLFALGIGAFRLAIELLPDYQEKVVARVREATGLALQFDSVYARIGRYGPEVVFRGARVLPESGDAPLMTAAAGRVSLSIPRSLWFRRLEVARVVFVKPRLGFVITPDGRLRLVGQSALERPGVEQAPLTLDRLPRGRFAVTDAVLDVLDLRAKQGRFELTGADLDVERVGDAITLAGRVNLPGHLGAFIDLEAEATGNLADLGAVAWRARVDARSLDLAEWAAMLPDSFRVPTAGHGSLRVAARGRGAAVTSLRLTPDLEDLVPAGSDQRFTRVAGDIRLQRDESTVSVEATAFELSRPDAPWPPTSVEARLTRKDGRIATVAARAGQVRIENLAALATALPPSPLRERVAALAPRGLLTDLDLTVTDAGRGRAPDVSGRVRFQDLGLAPMGRSAGFSGIDGSLEGRGAEGLLRVATRDATIDWPQQWRAAVPVLRADATLGWQRFGAGLRLFADDASADSGHGSARGRLRLLLRPGEVPLMDVSATVAGFDVTQVWRYLQTGRLSPKTLGWLDAAFRAGRVTDATVEITGPTKGFPYRESQGRFRAAGHATGVDLFYASGWPPIEDVEADFQFDGPGLHAVARRGRIGGVGFTDGEVLSADLRDALFAVRGRSRTDAGRGLRMLQGTPLAPAFGAAFAGLEGSGPVEADVTLVLPIKSLDRRVVTVQAALRGVTLRQRGQPWEAADLAGTLWVRNREVQAPSLTGRALGGRFEIGIATTAAPGGSLRTVVTGAGRLQGAALQPLAHMPVNAGLEGETGWRGTLEIERQADAGLPARGTLRLDSDLRGLASALPEPFAKRADGARPLTLTASFDGRGGPRIEGALGRGVHAQLQWRSNPADPPIERGVVAFGGERPAALPREPGLWLRGRLERASLTRLLDLQWTGPRGRPVQEWVAGADLAVDRLEAVGYEFTGLDLRLRPGSRAWDIDVDSAALAGRLSVPFAFPGEVPMVLDLARLELAGRAAGLGERPDPDPRRLPAIRVQLGDFTADGRRFGAVTAELTRGTAGMTLNRFTMTHPSFTASGHGSWLVQGAAASCRLDLDAETGDLKGFMRAMQLGDQVEGKEGRLHAALRWPGAPEASAFERLSGRMEISAADGELTAVEPGAGRVFGLLSLSHLKRRLALDFNDLTGQGLSFDTLRGTFTLTDGDVFTDNLTLRGSAAEIGIAGHTNLRERSYDQTAVVTGQLGASLGVAGALAGGPVVGAALLLFSQVFKEPLQGATRGYYRITGSWDDPQVKRIDARELKDDRQAAQAGQGAP